MTDIKMGPVLSFRGVEETKWVVTALIVVSSDAKAPALTLEGKQGGEPVELSDNKTTRVLRYHLSVTLDDKERRVAYGFDDRRWEFTVPAKAATPRVAYVSCNGFSEPDDVRNLKKPLFAVWADFLNNHDEKFRPKKNGKSEYQLDKEQRWHDEKGHGTKVQRFHLLLMGGDQIYFDSIWSERDKLSKLSDWTELSYRSQIEFNVDAVLKRKIRAYYENLYADRWRARRDSKWGTADSKDRGSAAAMASIPTIMMWDDHDIFDGWGSYPPDLQYCPLFQTLFEEARRAFWIYQLQQREQDLPEFVDRSSENGEASDAPNLKPIDWTAVTAGDALSLPYLNRQPGFSYRFDVGPISLIVLDLRSERSQTQIMGSAAWSAFQAELNSVAESVEHVLIMSSVPVAYPKLALADIGLSVSGWLGIGPGAPDVIHGLADDLNDHWTHGSHHGELSQFVRSTISAAATRDVRITVLSGDVHVASWGTIMRKDVTPRANWLRVNQLTSSSVVHPPPAGLSQELFLGYVSHKAQSEQDVGTDYIIKMMQFPASDSFIQPKRNWLALELDLEDFEGTGRRRLWATWRCEGEPQFSNHLNAIHPVAKKVAAAK